MKVCVCDTVVTRYNELLLCCEQLLLINLVSSIPSPLKLLITYRMNAVK